MRQNKRAIFDSKQPKNLDSLAQMRTLIVVCAFLFSLCEFVLAQSGPLDDTAAFIHIAPSNAAGNACEEFSVSVVLSATDARVFELRFVHDEANFPLISVTAGSHPDLNVMPHLVDDDTIVIDAFFHPNFTGITTIATLTFLPANPIGDQVTFVGLIDGVGYSGTADNPEPMIVSGDTSNVVLEGTLPLPAESLIISPYNWDADSVLLRWNPVHFDQDGDPISPYFQVEFQDALNYPGVFTVVGQTTDTFFYHDYVQFEFYPGDTGSVNVGHYQIRASRCPE